MNGIILAGGEGVRLRPYTIDTPKPMLEVSGKPILHWLTRQLGHAGVKEVVLMENYLSESIQEYFNNPDNQPNSDMNIIHALDKQPNNGTAELVKAASGLFSNIECDTFLMAGDTLIDLDLKDMAAHHIAKQALITIAVRRERLAHGIFESDDENKITDTQEKPEVIIPTATMLIKREVIDNVDINGDFFLNIVPAIEEGGYVFEVSPDQVIHISERRDDLLKANDLWSRIQRGRP